MASKLENLSKLLAQIDSLLSDIYDSEIAEDPETGEVHSNINDLEKQLALVRKEFKL